MFDIGWQELFIVLVLAIIVVGPKDLPRVIRTVTGWIRKARALSRDFQNGIDDIVRDAELDELRKTVNEGVMGGRLEDKIENMIDPDREIAKSLNVSLDDHPDEAGLETLNGSQPEKLLAPDVMPDPGEMAEDETMTAEPSEATEVATDTPKTENETVPQPATDKHA